jgi:hypothetical protein
VGAIVGSYFQYNSWREDQNLTRYKQDLAHATEIFSEVATAISSTVQLQQILFFLFREAATAKGDTLHYAFLQDSAQVTFRRYVDARTSLRERADVLARKAEIFLDWPSDPRHREASSGLRAESSINKYRLDLAGYPCILSDIDLKLLESSVTITIEKTQIDWSKAQHHVATLYYCINDIHARIFFVRVWASAKTSKDDLTNQLLPEWSDAEVEATRAALNSQVSRLNAFMTMAMTRIEDIRTAYRPKGFICHMVGLFCGN